ncbi:MAG: HEPN domain-containing protein [Bacteroidia bacterium]
MHQHLKQALHNQTFHDCIESNFTNQFYDWKITVLFYVAIHYLKALATKKKIDIGETHYEIESSVNPDRNNVKMRISRTAWREYKNLFNYSRTARYEGITDFETFEKLKQVDHSFCLIHLDNFKKYIEGQGVDLK